MKADFIIKRLTRMSFAEIYYRTFKLFQGIKDKTKYHKDVFDYSIIEKPGPLFKEDFLLPFNDELIKDADMICDNRFNIFALKNYCLGEKIDFHKDYKSCLAAPKNLYYKNIDYRDASKIGDIKYIWELNRHLFLTKLAVAYRMTGEKKYINQFNLLLTEWIKQNPFMMGINWASSLELGIRLINWTICMHLLEDVLEDGVKESLIKAIYQHCWYINRNFSLFSSANNHLIGEAAGLFIASTALPRFKESDEWQDLAYRILERETAKQNYFDGVNKEQAIAYQQFVLDFLLLSGLIGERYNRGFSKEYWGIMESMCVYLASIENVSGVIPQIGDDDDGFVIDLGQRNFGAHRSILYTASQIFKREDFKSSKMQCDLKTELLMSIVGVDYEGIKPDAQKPLREKFEHGGYYILNQKGGSAQEQKLIFDCGPLGYLSIAAHGHADALSFCFSAGGHPIFIDPGTYAYHNDKFWRNYFRSTKAHNTVCLNNTDQSVITGNFMWSKKATAKLIKYRSGKYVKGMHDGYKGSGKNSMIHQRELEYKQQTENVWTIVDEFIGSGSHTIEICFHLDRSCFIEYRDEKNICIRFPKGLCNLYYELDLTCEIFCGDDTLPLGWHSPSYDVKYPTNTIILTKQIEGNSTIQTSFKVEFD